MPERSTADPFKFDDESADTDDHLVTDLTGDMPMIDLRGMKHDREVSRDMERTLHGRPTEDRGGHSPKPQPVDPHQVVAKLPKGPAPGATKKPEPSKQPAD